MTGVLSWTGNERAGLRRRLLRSFASFRTDVAFAVIDAILVAAAYAVGLMLRFVDQPTGAPAHWWSDFAVVLPVIVLVHLLSNVAFGTYGHVWEFASIAEAVRIAVASASAGIVLLASVLTYRLAVDEVGPIPIGSLVMGVLLTLLLTGAVRFRSRLFSFNRMSTPDPGGRRVLIVGAGRAAADLARHGRVAGQQIRVVGFVTDGRDDPVRRLAGLSILGTIANVPALVEEHDVDEVIVASTDGTNIVRRLVDLCMTVDVRLRIVPDIDTVLVGNASVQDVRDLEPDDLLVRPSVQTELDEVAAILKGRRVMVTGAGGSIGSEIVRQVLSFEPGTLLALDHDETHLHEGMQSWGHFDNVRPVLCDLRDRTRVLRVMERHQPEVVFRAAAHKHVPILEDNPEEAIKTNVLGTAYLLDGARRVGVDRFVLISTDKAADPVNVMGASKRIAEMLVQEMASRGDGVYSAVRFGNVLGSRGSVVPTFINQIKQGGPVRVTDPRMTRYFMTTAEAVELVLQAASMADGGEILVLDMGEQVRIVDLAHRLIRMAGLVPERDVAVEFTGARPGEKMQEILSSAPLRQSSHPRIQIADQGWAGHATLTWATQSLVRRAARGDCAGVRSLLLSLATREWGRGEDVLVESVGLPDARPA